MGGCGLSFDNGGIDGLEETSHGHVDISVGSFEEHGQSEFISLGGCFPDHAPLQGEAGGYFEVVPEELEGIEGGVFHEFTNIG